MVPQSIVDVLSERADRALAVGGVVAVTWAEYRQIKHPGQPLRPLRPMTVDGVPAIIVDMPPLRHELVHP